MIAMILTQGIVNVVGLSSALTFVVWRSLERTGPLHWLDATIGIALFAIAGVAWMSCLAVTLHARVKWSRKSGRVNKADSQRVRLERRRR